MGFAIIGTAGHVDHGKTELIKALTGQDTDRLKEEKARGISIDLGFASFLLPDGRKVGIIDVPGHERFIKNMLAGAVGMDLVLLVIAADEGIMPQTVEHLNIMELLGHDKGIVVLTKVDLVDREWLEFIREEIREGLKNTTFAQAPMVEVASTTGKGIQHLKEIIAQKLEDLDLDEEDNKMYMPIDRVFTVSGFGTVVTGTLLQGKAAKEDWVEVLPRRKEVRIRGVQVHGENKESAWRGQRVALNLANIKVDEIERGSVLATPHWLTPSDLLDVKIKILADAPKELNFRERVRIHLGTDEIIGRVKLLEGENILPGEEGFAQLFLEKEVAARRGELFVIRTYSPMTTIGGGKVLDSSPVPHRRYKKDVLQKLELIDKGKEEDLLLAKIRRHEPYLPEAEEREEIASLLERKEIEKIGDGYYLANRLMEIEKKAQEVLEDFHRRFPLRKGIEREKFRNLLMPGMSVKEFGSLLEHFVQKGVLETENKLVRRMGFSPEFKGEALRLREEILKRLHGFSPPLKEKICKEIAANKEDFEEVWAALKEEGTIVEVEEQMGFQKEDVIEAIQRINHHFSIHPELTLGQFRDMLNTSRKYALPLIEYLDKIKITKRQGDIRKKY